MHRGDGDDAGRWMIAIPELPDFADTAFANNHCFRYAGQGRVDNDSVIRVEYEPVPWLDKEVGGMKVFDRLVSYAEHWRALDTNKHGLADYGGVNNLLEAVSSYVHEVAGLNAANVHNLRFAAELVEHKGDKSKADAMRKEANDLGRRVLDLYVPGKGIWKNAEALP